MHFEVRSLAAARVGDNQSRFHGVIVLRRSSRGDLLGGADSARPEVQREKLGETDWADLQKRNHEGGSSRGFFNSKAQISVEVDEMNSNNNPHHKLLDQDKQAFVEFISGNNATTDNRVSWAMMLLLNETNALAFHSALIEVLFLDLYIVKHPF